MGNHLSLYVEQWFGLFLLCSDLFHLCWILGKIIDIFANCVYCHSLWCGFVVGASGWGVGDVVGRCRHYAEQLLKDPPRVITLKIPLAPKRFGKLWKSQGFSNIYPQNYFKGSTMFSDVLFHVVLPFFVWEKQADEVVPTLAVWDWNLWWENDPRDPQTQL